MTKITLKDIIYLLSGGFTYISTDNDSFPEKYRCKRIFYGELFRDIRKNGDDHMLDKVVKTIELRPVNDYPKEKVIEYNTTYGFLYRDDNGYPQPIAPVINLVLESDNDT